MTNQMQVYKEWFQGNRLIVRAIVLVTLLVVSGLLLLIVVEKNNQDEIVENTELFVEQKPSPILTCGACPQFVPLPPGYCSDGHLIPQGKNSCGCQLPIRCIKNSSVSPQIVVTKINGKCQTKEKQNFIISQEGKKISFSGIITEVSSCDNFIAFSNIVGNTMVVYLQNEGNSKICSECIGAVTIKGESKDLPGGITLVKIVFADKGGEVVLAEKVIN